MKLRVGQRVLISNPLGAKSIPDPCFGHVVSIEHDPFWEKFGARIDVFNPVPDGMEQVFVAEEHYDEALTPVD